MGDQRGMIERETAFSTLQRLLEDSRGGKGQLAIVQGPLGSGKSELMRGFLETVEDSPTLVLSASASRWESTLPFGVLSQLFQNSRIPHSVRADLNQMFIGLTEREQSLDPESADLFPVDMFADLHKTLLVLTDLAERNPLVIGIDNLHYIDGPSLRWLAYVLPRLRFARALVVLTDDAARGPADSFLRSELLQQPNAQRIPVGPLTPEGVARLVARDLGDGAASRRGHEFAAVSGGNLLVLRHLIRDARTGDEKDGQAYGAALRSCLNHCDPMVLTVVRALAVLGTRGSPAELARLADVEEWEVNRALRSLNEARLLDGTAFRHPTAAVAVLDTMAVAERSDLHERAAVLLHSVGAPTLAIAEQLSNADRAVQPWAVDVLLAAARESLTANRIQIAAGYLRLAERAAADALTGAPIRVRLSRIGWQVDPGSASRSLPAVIADASAGHLAPCDVLELIWELSWYGEVGAVADVLDGLRGRGQGPHGVGAEDAQGVLSWLACLYPSYGSVRRPVATAPGETSGACLMAPWLTAGSLAGGFLRGRSDDVAAQAEQALENLILENDSLWSGEVALLALLVLVYTDRLDSAAGHCDRLLAEAGVRHAPAWQAAFTAVRAEIALRQGNLKTAAREAQAALDIVPAQGWGVALGLPLGCLILAHVRMGRLDVAAKFVAQGFPCTMLQSRYGLHYLYARGHYRLASGHAQSALADFLACGELMDCWEIYGTGPVSWRTSAAEAWIKLGNQDQAKHLVRDQLSRLPPGSARVRGRSLRLLAAASSTPQRPQLLEEAVDLLHDCGDKFELALALIDLSHASQKAGDLRGARRLARRAWHAAKAIGAEALCARVAPEYREKYPVSARKKSPKALSALSKQERRVAELASEGYTNQEIADQLFITKSTVEQHLTRVFRKLNVQRRQELSQSA
ncbi:LuxR C-terminal-related transcriptional regulator [Streptomyces parvus]|uniref:helix-turn-helix transcriptional regulator n=1 Tax=Streptomyces parvus TaxID=66428 RepID=UPI003D71DE44